MRNDLNVSNASTQISKLSSVKKALLEKRLKGAFAESRGSQIIPRRRVGGSPLSFAQQRLWFLHQLEPSSAAYNFPAALRLRGKLNISAMEWSISEIIRRHEILRTTFAMVKGQPVQVIAPKFDISIPIIDLSDLPEGTPDAEVRRLATEEAQQPFDLSKEPLLRMCLLYLGEQAEAQDYVLLFTMHHIVSDGWSGGILIHEFMNLYEAFNSNQLAPLPELPIQYADFAVWQREWLQGEVLERQLSYWREQLAGAPEVLTLPTDRPRPVVQSYRGASYAFTLSSVLTERLHVLSRREGVTLFMTLLAAFKVLLRYETGQDDIVVGTDVANRNRKEIEGLVGFFVNQLVVRTNLSGDLTFSGLLRRIQQVALDAYAHQDLPFEKLVEVLNPRRNLGWAPMFQIKVVLHNLPQSIGEVSGLAVSAIRMDRTTAELDLLLDVLETNEGLNCLFEYNTDLFEVATISRYAEHIATVLRTVATDSNSTLKMLENKLAAIDSRGQRMEEEQLKTANYRKLANIRRTAVKAKV